MSASPTTTPTRAAGARPGGFAITLSEVKRQELPPLDDALAREVGDFDTLDALKEAIRADLAREAERGAEARVREELVNLLAEANNVDTPSVAGGACAARLHARVRNSPRAACDLRRTVPADRGAAGPARPGPERGGGAAGPAGHGSRAGRADPADRRGPECRARRRSTSSSRRAAGWPSSQRSITEEKVFAWLLDQSTVNQG